MQKKMKNKWVEALVSDKFKQGRGHLRQNAGRNPEDGYAFCVLGVLCELHDNNRWRSGLATLYDGQAAYDFPAQDGQWEFPPIDIVMEYNIPKSALTTLAEMNDEGMSFNDLADWIEKNL